MDLKPASPARLAALKSKAPKMDAPIEDEGADDGMGLVDIIDGVEQLLAAAGDNPEKKAKLEQVKKLLEECYDADEESDDDKKGTGLVAEDALGIAPDSGMTG